MGKTSYKDMIRNRISDMRSVDLALKWCKAKERWIEHTYDNFINIYIEKLDRHEATRIILGLSGKHRGFNFHSTINWDNLDNHENQYWEAIESWIDWFDENLIDVQQDIQNGEDIESKYSLSETFTKYLINNLS